MPKTTSALQALSHVEYIHRDCDPPTEAIEDSYALNAFLAEGFAALDRGNVSATLPLS